MQTEYEGRSLDPKFLGNKSFPTSYSVLSISKTHNIWSELLIKPAGEKKLYYSL